MEYIKVLIALRRVTGESDHLAAADHHIEAHQVAMVRDGGLREVYDGQGQVLPLSRSTGQADRVMGSSKCWQSASRWGNAALR